MKKLIIALLLLFATTCFAVPVHIFFNQDNGVSDSLRIVLLGLPDSPIECTFHKVTNPDDPSDENYYEADFDVSNIPDGSYTLTGKMKDMWGESEESAPFPFVKKVPAALSNMELDAR